jgi:hypothetical protein
VCVEHTERKSRVVGADCDGESEQAGGAKDCGDVKVRRPVDLWQHVLILRKLILLFGEGRYG